MKPLKISAVSYLNTFPFVYGILNSGYLEEFSLELDVPSVCAEKLKNGDVDIALVPVGAMPDLIKPLIITDYCIGAVKSVKSVVLLSQVPLETIRSIYLDFDSRTSVQLVKVLAQKFWKIDPEWKRLKAGQAEKLNGNEALVAIGDKTFELVKHYKFVYDLAEEWFHFTSLPFVFAAWMSIKPIPEPILQSLNSSLAWGIARKAEALDFFQEKLPACDDCLKYLEENISYELDTQKKKGLAQFILLLDQLNS
jgi:chorismate dehydratase